MSQAIKEKAASDQRNFFRMAADDFENGAGLMIKKRIIPAELLDYSLKGCSLGVKKRVSVAIGDEVRVATTKGQYKGIVRRVEKSSKSKGPFLGIEFVGTVDPNPQTPSSWHLFSARKTHKVGGNYSLVITVLIAALIAFYLFFDKLTY